MTRLALEIHQMETADDALQLNTRGNHAILEIDVLPAQSKGLALAQSDGKCHGEDGFQPVSTGGRREAAGVIESSVSQQLARIYRMRLAAENARGLRHELTRDVLAARRQAETSALFEVVAGYQLAINEDVAAER